MIYDGVLHCLARSSPGHHRLRANLPNLGFRKRNREKVDPEDTSKAADGETGEQPPTEEVPKADNPSSTDKELSSLGPGTPQVLPEVE